MSKHEHDLDMDNLMWSVYGDIARCRTCKKLRFLDPNASLGNAPLSDRATR